jgi:hypothetical protein
MRADDAKAMIYTLYPDEPWADEWGFSLWCSWCYLRRHQREFEEERLVVIGRSGAIMLNGLIYALYNPFLSCPKDQLETLDPPIKEIAAKAHEFIVRFPAKENPQKGT